MVKIVNIFNKNLKDRLGLSVRKPATFASKHILAPHALRPHVHQGQIPNSETRIECSMIKAPP